MAERIQFPALDDLETVIRSLSRTSKGPVAAVFDPKRGWCVTDEVRVVESKHGALEVAFTCQTYKDWFRESISEACAQLFAVRFVPGTLLGKLFKVPMSAAAAGTSAVGERKQEQLPPAPHPKRPATDTKLVPQSHPSGQRREPETKGAVTVAKGGQAVQHLVHQTPTAERNRASVTAQSGNARPPVQGPVPSQRIPAAASFLPRRTVKPTAPASPPKIAQQPPAAREKPQKRARNADDDFPELPV